MALRPWTEGWVCRSTPPAGGSTPPRRRCSPAGPQAERLGVLRLLEPEMPPDLKCDTTHSQRNRRFKNQQSVLAGSVCS